MILDYNEWVMTRLAKPRFRNTWPVAVFCTWLIALGAVSYAPVAMSHPLEYHLDPLDDEAIERVLTSFELLSAGLEKAGLQGNARLSENALGITAIVWSTEAAVMGMDESRSVDSPSLLRALKAAGYEESPYVVAEWKLEAERVWEAYEVLSANLQITAIGRDMEALEQQADDLTPQQRTQQQAALMRQLSMLQTTAGDISRVAPFRQRMDSLARRLGN